ncbi:MAG: methyltransferase domain-containing protein, partial [Pseudomonadota bacterium]
LCFQWCSDLDQLFAECRRVLAPNGLFIFSSLGPDTLRELKAAYQSCDDSPHVHDFIDMHDVGDALIRAGFAAPVLQTDHITMSYQKLNQLFKDLRGIGATNKSPNRKRSISAKAVYKSVEQYYERLRSNELLPATYEVVYAHAFSPTGRDPVQDGSSVVSFPLSELKRR